MSFAAASPSMRRPHPGGPEPGRRRRVRELGVVATPCQATAIAQMRLNPWRTHRSGPHGARRGPVLHMGPRLPEDSRPSWRGKGLPARHGQDRYPAPPGVHPGSVFEGGQAEFSLDEIRPLVPETCGYCPDMTSEFADVSVGVLEGRADMNTLIVRTERGKRSSARPGGSGTWNWRRCRAENLEHLVWAAGKQEKARGPALPRRRGGSTPRKGRPACAWAGRDRQDPGERKGVALMSFLIEEGQCIRHLLMGNEAIVRGALEAGVNVATGYPGTPSSEIIECSPKVAGERNMYVEWSTNEKVAAEVAAAASFAGLRSMCVMKQNGVNVASDFLLHLASSGTRGGMVLVTCDDPGPSPASTRGNRGSLPGCSRSPCWNRGISRRPRTSCPGPSNSPRRSGTSSCSAASRACPMPAATCFTAPCPARRRKRNTAAAAPSSTRRRARGQHGPCGA